MGMFYPSGRLKWFPKTRSRCPRQKMGQSFSQGASVTPKTSLGQPRLWMPAVGQIVPKYGVQDFLGDPVSRWYNRDSTRDLLRHFVDLRLGVSLLGRGIKSWEFLTKTFCSCPNSVSVSSTAFGRPFQIEGAAAFADGGELHALRLNFWAQFTRCLRRVLQRIVVVIKFRRRITPRAPYQMPWRCNLRR